MEVLETQNAANVKMEKLSDLLSRISESGTPRRRESDIVLSEFYDNASKALALSGLPTGREEKWKYTDISKVLNGSLLMRPSRAADQDKSERPQLSGSWNGNIAVIVDGVFSPASSNLGKEVVVSTIREAAKSHSAIVGNYFGRCIEDSDSLAMLNQIDPLDGLFVYAPPGEVGQLLIMNVQTEHVANALLQPRFLVVAEERAKLSIICSQGDDTANGAVTNAVSELYTNSHARIEFACVQEISPRNSIVNSIYVEQESNSVVSTSTASLSGKLIRNNITFRVNGTHCESRLSGVVLANDSMHVDNHTIVDHAVPDCYSEELYKNIIADNAVGVFNGKVYVRRDAQRTNAYQSNKSIILGDTARMYSKPELEIYADDVKCSHGATTGQIDPEALFYLRSRGLSMEKATALLISAFTDDAIDAISDSEIRQYVRDRVEAKLPSIK